jgi:hypothetical protein
LQQPAERAFCISNSTIAKPIPRPLAGIPATTVLQQRLRRAADAERVDDEHKGADGAPVLEGEVDGIAGIAVNSRKRFGDPFESERLTCSSPRGVEGKEVLEVVFRGRPDDH